MKLQRILITLDGSLTAEGAIALAEPLLRTQDAAVDLLRVVPVAVELGRPLDPERLADGGRDARDYVERTAGALRDRGLNVRAHVRFGLPVEEILKFAAVERADLVAMTTHGHQGVRRWILGSVTEQILRGSHAPLLVRKSFDGIADAGLVPVRSILVPLDGTHESEQIFPLAADLARRYGAEIVVASVVGLADRIEKVGAAKISETYLIDAVGRHRERDVPMRHAVGRGDAPEGIARLIEQERPGLVAMATHGRSGVSRWILGSVVESVLRTVPTPLLVRRIHEPAHD